MIIVEGADLTGKTTFARKLAQALGFDYAHLSRLPPLFDKQFNHYLDYLPLIKPNVVWDRFHMSEVAYSYARNEDPSTWKIKPSYYYALDRMLLKRATIIIVVTAEREVIAERFFRAARSEMYSLEQIQRANEAYCQMMSGALFHDFLPFKHIHVHQLEADRFIDDELIEGVVHMQQALMSIASFLKSTEEIRIL